MMILWFLRYCILLSPKVSTVYSNSNCVEDTILITILYQWYCDCRSKMAKKSLKQARPARKRAKHAKPSEQSQIARKRAKHAKPSEQSQIARKRAKHAKPSEQSQIGRLIFRCSPPYLHKLVSELSSHISKEQLAAVSRTPFQQYWNIPDIPISSKFVIAVLKQWDSSNASLNIAGKVLALTVEDLSVVLGLKAHGRQVHLRSVKTKSKTLKELFKTSASKADRQMLTDTMVTCWTD